MRAATVLRVIWWFILLAVLTASGVYALRYVQAWEWQRSLWAGLIFLATLGVASLLLLLSRISRLERRLDALTRTPASSSPGQVAEPAVPDTASEPTPDFPWLRTPSRLSSRQVFMPILLGAGLLVSLIAALVERLARYATARSGRSTRSASAPGRGMRIIEALLGIIAGVVLIVAASIGIYRFTTYQPNPPQTGTREYVIDVAATLSNVRAVEATRAVGEYCGLNTRTWVRVEQVDLVAERRTRLVVSPLLAESAERRFRGCLQDRILERHLLDVVSTASMPATPLDGGAP